MPKKTYVVDHDGLIDHHILHGAGGWLMGDRAKREAAAGKIGLRF